MRKLIILLFLLIAFCNWAFVFAGGAISAVRVSIVCDVRPGAPVAHGLEKLTEALTANIFLLKKWGQ